MNESRIDEQPMSGDQREDAMLAAARTFNLVKDLLESLISQVMEKCENGIKNGKGVFSEGQRMILRKAFSESPRITGASLDRLLSRLGGCSRVQVQHWFANRRKIEELRKEEARLAATTWPFYKLNNAMSSFTFAQPTLMVSLLLLPRRKASSGFGDVRICSTSSGFAG